MAKLHRKMLIVSAVGGSQPAKAAFLMTKYYTKQWEWRAEEQGVFSA